MEAKYSILHTPGICLGECAVLDYLQKYTEAQETYGV